MDWPELLRHSFWTQIVNEENDVKEGERGEEDGAGDQEENNHLGVSPASMRSFFIIFSLELIAPTVFWKYSGCQLPASVCIFLVRVVISTMIFILNFCSNPVKRPLIHFDRQKN